MKDSPIYLPGLNGLRAIAALSVVISHISLKGIADFGFSPSFELPMAGYSVTLFFVISGFLITYLLQEEKRKYDTISIKKFYFRRILRIWPIYYLFLIICILVFLILGKQKLIIQSELWYYILFSANIPFVFQQGSLILAHYWSIGVEEQFYLFWPWVVQFSKKRFLKISIYLLILLFVIKFSFWIFLGSKSYEYRFFFVTRFYCMIIGAIGAILYYIKHPNFIFLFSSKISQIISWSLFLLMGFDVIHIPALISHELIAIVSLCLIIGQVYVKNRIVNLENKTFDFIGKISYGIYVIHPLVILLLSKLFKPLNMDNTLRYILVYSSVLILTIAISWLSYTYFESYFLKLKTKFTVVKSSNSMI